MRKTVTLDPDLAAKLHVLARERGVSFNDALNATLRRGLIETAPRTNRPYRLPTTRALELRPDVDLEHALRLAGNLEDLEAIRKLTARTHG